MDTPNIDKLETVILALGGDSPSVSTQISTIDNTRFWTVNFRRDGVFWIGQGASLALAINNLAPVPVPPSDAPVLAELEGIAA